MERRRFQKGIRQVIPMSKYNAKKIMVDGITFDSKKEAKRYTELKLLERAGKITGLELQPEFELQPAFDKDGKHYRKITYKADFHYIEDGQNIVEDVKGYRTDVYKLKKKLFEYKYQGLTIKEL